ncbi:helix-turn-helix domain-containing protein [Marivirga sp.]|uniref:helix-turn-helix domain-containing protein n=1 Tax=Marivirga sp. TaxID=2018662 RepID=UPI0025F22D65|nr:helix-turn-helix domain-containing protein [Marivirga sp.]
MSISDSNNSNSFISKLQEKLEANLSNEKFGVEELADAIGLSRSQVHRKLKNATGQSISQFIREYRLQKAKKLLLQEDFSAAEVAYKVGFNSPTYFSKAFHDYFGATPGKIKNSTSEIKKEKKVKRINYKLYAILIIIVALIFVFFYTKKNEIEEKLIQEKSIVVLPFANMSNNPDQQYFSDGIMEAVLNHLTALKDMHVISRTTSMRYKDTDKSIPEIAKELNVNYVLEGGVQESNGKIRVNAQLIEGKTDNHLWSEQYDRKLENIFTIQTDIAKNIAEALNTYISQEEIISINKPITHNPVAYENYLRGKYLLEGNWSLENSKKAINHFDAAIQRDPEFIEAYIWMGNSYITQGTWYGNLSNKQAKKLAKPYFDKAKEIDPEHPLLLWNIALIKYFFEWDFKEAAKLIEKAKEQGSRSGYIDFHLDLILRKFTKVIKECKQEIKSDSFAGTIYWNLAYAYYHMGETDKALQIIKKGFEIDPDQEAYYDHFGNLYNALGMHKKAEETLKKGLEVSDKRHASMIAHLAITYDKLNQPALRDMLIKELRERIAQNESMINVFTAHAYAGLNIPDSAFYYLERSYKRHEVDLIWLQTDPNLLLLKDDPRYVKLLDKIGFPEENRP